MGTISRMELVMNTSCACFSAGSVSGTSSTEMPARRATFITALRA